MSQVLSRAAQLKAAMAPATTVVVEKPKRLGFFVNLSFGEGSDRFSSWGVNFELIPTETVKQENLKAATLHNEFVQAVLDGEIKLDEITVSINPKVATSTQPMTAAERIAKLRSK